MANYNNSKTLDFLTFFIAELKINHIDTFDVTRFIEVIMYLKNNPEFAGVLNDFSTDFETCQSQMAEMCDTLNESKYIEVETIYKLNFLNQTMDRNLENLPKTIDKNLLNQFLNLIKTFQETNNQETISESQLWQNISKRQKELNYSEENIEKQRENITQYLNILSHFGLLTITKTYNVSIPDAQLQNVLKNYQREEYKKIKKQVSLFLEYYKHPEKLKSTPMDSEKFKSTMQQTPDVVEPKEENSLRYQINEDPYEEIPITDKPLSNIIKLFPENTRTTIIEPVDYIPIRSRYTPPNSHFKSVRGVLLSFLSTLQTKGIDHFDRESFEVAMNEIMKSSVYYEFPFHFPEFAEKYIGVPLKGKEERSNYNPYTALNEWTRGKSKYVKRIGTFCYKLQIPNDKIEYSLNHLTKEDIQKIDYLTEQYLAAFHKISR